MRLPTHIFPISVIYIFIMYYLCGMQSLQTLTLSLASNFSLQYHPQITHKGHKKKGNDQQRSKVLIVEQILLFSPLGNILRTEWRICILMLGCKG